MNSGSIKTLTNSGMISGGAGATSLAGGFGGSGVSNSRTITTLSNSGKIIGGDGGGQNFSVNFAGAGGGGVMNAKGAMIGSLYNAAGATIAGGNEEEWAFLRRRGRRGDREFRHDHDALSNRGTIRGGNAGAGSFLGRGGAGGSGVMNAGTVTSLSNSGTIAGGAGGAALWAEASTGGGAARGLRIPAQSRRWPTAGQFKAETAAMALPDSSPTRAARAARAS